MSRRVPAILVALALVLAAAGAVEPSEVLPDKTLEARARALSAELRCLVCQNQSIDDSEAPLARDLRTLVRERLRGGDTDGEVRAFLVARYGKFVLLKPPLDRSTLLLWGMPVVVLLGALVLMARPRPVEDRGAAPLTSDERKRIAAITDETGA